MPWIIYRYFPRFITEYFVVIEDPRDPTSGKKYGIPVRKERDADPKRACIRVKYFNFFGIPMFVRFYHRPPLH